MAAYITSTNLEDAVGKATLLVLFDDANTGSYNAAAMTAVISRACSWVDSFLAANYGGPFPVSQSPAPAMMFEASIYKAIEFSLDRKPEFVRNLNNSTRKNYNEAAEKLLRNLIDGVQYMPDYVAQGKPGNVGGVVFDGARRTMIDSPDGTPNSGDF